MLKAISEQAEHVDGAIVRLNISLPAECESYLRDNEVRSALGRAHYFTIAKDVRRETRHRLVWTAEEISPLEALKAYLGSKKEISREHARLLLEYGEKVMGGLGK